MQADNVPLSYRPEIDGLRAIAVLSVIFYHAQLSILDLGWLEGGYIGVDIFFVISGYLITRIILSELRKVGSFDVIKFYERRARRILPMLFVVVLASIPLATEIMLPTAFAEFADSIVAAFLFCSNFLFYIQTTEYGADSSLLKPFLHSWSLGVEEQFYLLFPLLAIFVHKYMRNWLILVLIALFSLSLNIAVVMEGRNPDLNFFLPFSRFWELAMGSILAARELGGGRQIRGELANQLQILGLMLIGLAIWTFDKNTLHPHYPTLIPVVGVALVIGSGSSGGWAQRVIGSTPMVYLGKLSYSAYLWHFPVFAFSRMNCALSESDKLLLVGASFLLSGASYKFVETPFRSEARVPIKTFLAVTITALIFALVALFEIKSNKLESLTASSGQYIIDNQYLVDQRKNNFGRGWEIFSRRIPNAETVLVIGDSHAFDMFQILKSSKYAEKFNFELCGIQLVYFETDHYDQKYVAELAKGGLERTRNCLEGKVMLAADVVVISDSFDEYELQYVDKLIGYLKSKGKKVVLMGRSLRWEAKPQLRTFLDELYLKNGMSLDGIDFVQASKEFYKRRRKREENDIDFLRVVAAKHGVSFLDKRDYQCNLGLRRCDLVTPELQKIYSDFHHVTLEGAMHFGGQISKTDWFKID